jgi:threonine synthase
MKYRSTRGDPARLNFCDILLEGLAPDGGLYLPEQYPQIAPATLAHWRKLSYVDLAYEIFQLYIDDIPAQDLRGILRKTYNASVFGSSAITPIRTLKPQLHMLRLSNGPTHAFKDIAMQWLGHVFEYALAKRGQQLNILGATSGDTGSAAEYAMRGKQGVRVFMTSPYGRMSDFQQAQMFSLQDSNIHNAALHGVFDDCQDIVKAISHDHGFKAQYAIGTVNSINWARLLAQVVYYFYAYFQVTSDDQTQVNFSVPSGNFGNVCAGHIARMMGLPVKQLIVATNENNVLHEFFQNGTYRPRSSAQTLETSSPSMDISKASNLERFIFDLLGGDSAAVKDVFTQHIRQPQGWQLDAEQLTALARFGFASGTSNHAARLACIARIYNDYGLVIDPHTADGFVVAAQYDDALTPMVVLETALPLKFAATVEQALGFAPTLGADAQALLQRPRKCEVMPADLAAVKAWIERTVALPV